jgi:hypothetical protein
MANPVVEAAKEQAVEKESDDIVVLSTGVRARLRWVSPRMIMGVVSKIKYPRPPVFSKGDREIENPDHPDYKRDCAEVDQARGMAAFDAMAMFGIELADPIPEDRAWIAKLRLLGIEFDEDDPIAIEFNYKRHIALGAEDYALIGSRSGISQEAIRQAEETFQR